ncbi:MAG TPA: acyl-CoA dehydrogenase family protein [Candidatus Binataceae bacterium]|jgi:acyl-CoA dehydrogenase|nr:acyl-CoA dehydrogenase family protein [Candidatus Binataceae bacterium]
MENGERGFELSEELKTLRQQVRRIIRDEIIPIENRLDPDAAEIPEHDYWAIARKTQAAGLWCMGVAQKYGGAGLGTFAMCVLYEEMAQHRMGLYNPGAGVFGRTPPPVIWAGTEEQIQTYAVPAIKNAWYTFFGITEPAGGSDPAGAIQCRAARDGDSYVLNGTKIFTSHAHEAEWGVVFTRTDPTAGRAGITAFIIKKNTPGFTPRPFKVLRTAALPCEVQFEDCRVPLAQRLGPEGGGLSLCLDLLTRLRFPYSACNIGVGVAALEMAVKHAKQRKTFGELLARRQAIQWMLADSEVELRAARWLTWDGAWKADRGEDARMEASIAKLYSSEVLGRVVDRAVQIHGGYGVSKEFPLERWYREARIRRIGEGPSEVHRMVIARNLLR